MLGRSGTCVKRGVLAACAAARPASAAATASNVNMAMWYDAVKDSVAQLIEQAIMLSQKYDGIRK